MDYRYLKAFLLTAQFESFSKAAEALSIAQSAVSRQIKLLEETLGEELIIRSSKKIILTHKGEELFAAASHFDRMASDIFQREDNRPLTVGILSGLLKNWFLPIVVRYYKKYSRNLNIRIEDQPELRSGIEEGKYDAIFSTENIQSELVTSLKLFDEKFVLISKGELNKRKLHEERWIVFGEGDHLFELSKKRSDHIVSVESISAIVGLVSSGVGIAVVPDHVLKKGHGLTVSELPGQNHSEIYLSTLNFRSHPAPIRELLDVIQSS